MTTSYYPPTSKTQTKSRPERLAEWLFKTCGSWRNVMGFLLVVGLTYISIRFNVELGKLSAVDETSKELLPAGYGLLDLCALFLSGYIGLKSRSPVRKLIAWAWFGFLLCLSLWAAASFTLSVDARLEHQETYHAIDSKKEELETQSKNVELWQENLANTTLYKTRYTGLLNIEQEKYRQIQAELEELEGRLPPATQAIYEVVAPRYGLTPETLSTIVRLLWAGALTLSPIILVLLIAVEFGFIEIHHPTPTPSTTPTNPSGRGRKRGFTNWFHEGFKFKSFYSKRIQEPLPTTAELQTSKEDNLTQVTPELTQTGKPEVTQTSKGKANESEGLEKKTSKPKKKKSKGTGKVRTTDSADTGTDSSKGKRYSEIREKVSAGKVRPSKPAIKKAAQCGQITAEKYLSKMEGEGIIFRLENGQYRLADNKPLLRAVT